MNRRAWQHHGRGHPKLPLSHAPIGAAMRPYHNPGSGRGGGGEPLRRRRNWIPLPPRGSGNRQRTFPTGIDLIPTPPGRWSQNAGPLCTSFRVQEKQRMGAVGTCTVQPRTGNDTGRERLERERGSRAAERLTWGWTWAQQGVGARPAGKEGSRGQGGGERGC
jgi:hypothetical protein